MTLANPTENIETSSVLPDDDALETVAFLARSEHRIHVLSLLRAGELPQTEISEAVDATRVTLSRILNDLADRDLITRQLAENTYTLTQFGEVVYQNLRQLLAVVSATRTNPGVLDDTLGDSPYDDLSQQAITELSGSEGNAQRPSDGIVAQDDALETVAFLARSEHRLHVLSILSDGERLRDEIREAVNVTRVTLSRILSDLEDRNLITRRLAENTYAFTQFGEVVYQGFERLLGTVSVSHLGAAVLERLPVDWFDFDLRCLATAELVTGASADPMAAARVVANSVQNASTRHALLGTFLSLPFHTFEDALQDGDEPDGAVIFDVDVTETILNDSALSEHRQEIENMADSTVYYSVDASLPCGIAVHDGETAFLTVDRRGDNGFDVLRSSHPDVVDWVTRTIGDWQTEAVPLRTHLDG